MRWCLVFLALFAAHAQDTRPVELLLGIGDQPMNLRACSKERNDGKPMTIAQDLATYLTLFREGENRVSGSCKAGACSIELSHRSGEDVFSAIYRFKLTSRGAVIRTSLVCQWTP